MTIYKIAVHNKTYTPLYFKLVDPDSNSMGYSIKIEPDKIKSSQTDSTITNLFIWKDSKSDTTPIWIGAVPSNTYLEVDEDSTGISVFLENEKIPARVIENLKCGPKGCNYNLVNILIVLLIIIIACVVGGWLFYKKK